MKQAMFTAVTGELIEAGAVARVPFGVRGLTPCRVVKTTAHGSVVVAPINPTARGSVVVAPINPHEPKWDDPRPVPAGDVWYLLSAAEVKAMGLPA